MQDSGERQTFGTGAVRDTAAGKPRIDLQSPFAHERVGAWLAAGAAKYSERNWEKGIPFSRCLASLERHLQAWKAGDRDEDHLAAVVVNAQFLIHYERAIELGLLPSTLDDMPKYLQHHRIRPDETPSPPTVPLTAYVIPPDKEKRSVTPLENRVKWVMRPVAYISGPMRGKPQYNFPEFDRVRDQFALIGYMSVSPADIDRENGIDLSTPEAASGEYPDEGGHAGTLDEIQQRDVSILMAMQAKRGDAIVMLDGWERSKGATAEFFLARWRGLKLLDERGDPLAGFCCRGDELR